MPVPLTTIHAANEFSKPSELYNQVEGYLEDFITFGGGEHLRKLDQSKVYWTGNKPTSIENGMGSVTVSGSTGRVDVLSDADVIINPDGVLEINCNSINKFRVNPAFGTINFYDDLTSTPSGTGINVTADGFVEHSLATLKANIKDIPDAASILASMRARQYDVNNKETLGFVVEENPAQIIETWIDEKGETAKGVNLSSILAVLVDEVQSLRRELIELKARLKV